jgi:hypothetical protein
MSAISPRSLADRFGGIRVKNFAFNAQRFDERYLAAANRVLDPKSRARRILLGVTPQALLRSRAAHAPPSPTADPPSGVERLAAAISEHFEPLNKRLEIQNLLHPRQAVSMRMVYGEDGWVSTQTNLERPEAWTGYFEALFRNERFDVLALNSLSSAIGRWRTHGVRVYAMRPPTTKEMVALENRLSGFEEVAVVRALEEAGATWIPVPDSTWHAYDGSHLDRESAERFSAWLGQRIRELESAPAHSSRSGE